MLLVSSEVFGLLNALEKDEPAALSAQEKAEYQEL